MQHLQSPLDSLCFYTYTTCVHFLSVYLLLLCYGLHSCLMQIAELKLLSCFSTVLTLLPFMTPMTLLPFFFSPALYFTLSSMLPCWQKSIPEYLTFQSLYLLPVRSYTFMPFLLTLYVFMKAVVCSLALSNAATLLLPVMSFQLSLHILFKSSMFFCIIFFILCQQSYIVYANRSRIRDCPLPLILNSKLKSIMLVLIPFLQLST